MGSALYRNVLLLRFFEKVPFFSLILCAGNCWILPGIPYAAGVPLIPACSPLSSACNDFRDMAKRGVLGTFALKGWHSVQTRIPCVAIQFSFLGQKSMKMPKCTFWKTYLFYKTPLLQRIPAQNSRKKRKFRVFFTFFLKKKLHFCKMTLFFDPFFPKIGHLKGGPNPVVRGCPFSDPFLIDFWPKMGSLWGGPFLIFFRNMLEPPIRVKFWPKFWVFFGKLEF